MPAVPRHLLDQSISLSLVTARMEHTPCDVTVTPPKVAAKSFDNSFRGPVLGGVVSGGVLGEIGAGEGLVAERMVLRLSMAEFMTLRAHHSVSYVEGISKISWSLTRQFSAAPSTTRLDLGSCSRLGAPRAQTSSSREECIWWRDRAANQIGPRRVAPLPAVALKRGSSPMETMAHCR